MVAAGARTPVGLNADATGAAVRAGISRVSEHPFFADTIGDPVMFASDNRLDPLQMVRDRIVAMLRSTIDEVLAQLAHARPIAIEVPVLVTLPGPRPGLDATQLQRLEAELTALRVDALPKAKISCVGRGHAGGGEALQRAHALLAGGQVHLCIVAGVDSYADGFTLDWLEETRRLACEEARAGFPPGEGAAALALVPGSVRRSMGFDSLAVLRAVATTRDLEATKTDAEPLGQGLTAAVNNVARQLRRPVERFDQLYIDINGERPRTTDLGFVGLRCGPLFRDVSDYVSSVQSTGDLGAASVPLNVGLAAHGWTRNYAPGRNALVLGSSWGGLRAAVFLERGAA